MCQLPEKAAVKSYSFMRKCVFNCHGGAIPIQEDFDSAANLYTVYIPGTGTIMLNGPRKVKKRRKPQNSFQFQDQLETGEERVRDEPCLYMYVCWCEAKLWMEMII